MQRKTKKNDKSGKNIPFMEFVMNISRPIYLQQLINCMSNSSIKSVTGLHRCGRSYLLFELFAAVCNAGTWLEQPCSGHRLSDC